MSGIAMAREIEALKRRIAELERASDSQPVDLTNAVEAFRQDFLRGPNTDFERSLRAALPHIIKALRQ
jgi:hypothetical protein